MSIRQGLGRIFPLALGLLLLTPSCLVDIEVGKHILTILFTGDVSGTIEPCG